MTIFTLINRKITDQDNITVSKFLNRGFSVGEGVFTTCLVRKNQILFAREHFDRLKNSAALFGLFFNEDGLYEAVHKFIEQHSLHTEWVRLRITLSRTQTIAGLRVQGDEIPIEVIQISSYQPQQNPLHLMFRDEYMTIPICMNGVKHVGYQNSILLLNHANRAGFDDGIMFSMKGNIACTTSANVFLKLRGEWVTPPLSEGIIPGIIRQKILKSGKVKETKLTCEDIKNCTSCFITNSLQGCRPVARINEQLLDYQDSDIAFLNNYINYSF